MRHRPFELQGDWRESNSHRAQGSRGHCPLTDHSSSAAMKVDEVRIELTMLASERRGYGPLDLHWSRLVRKGGCAARQEGVEPSAAGFGGPCPCRWGFCRRSRKRKGRAAFATRPREGVPSRRETFRSGAVDGDRCDTPRDASAHSESRRKSCAADALRAHDLTRYFATSCWCPSMSCVTTSGSASVLRSPRPVYSPAAILRSTRRMIFPLRVLGRPFTAI